MIKKDWNIFSGLSAFVVIVFLITKSGFAIEARITDSSFYLLPIESKSKINSQIIEYNFNDRIAQKGGIVKRDFRVTRRLRAYNYSFEKRLDYTLKNLSPDFVLYLKASENEKKQLVYEFTIFNSKKVVVFNKKETMLRVTELKKEKIDSWIDEFLTAVPKSGTIEKIDEQIVYIKFNKEVDPETIKGLDFIITTIGRKDEVDSGDQIAKGVITRVDKDFSIGNVYSQYGDLKKGQRVILLQKDESETNIELQKGVEVTDRSLVYNNPFVNSMRSCVLLPIIGGDAFYEELYDDLHEAFSEVEKCDFRDGSDIRELLMKYGTKESYLYNKQVLSLIAKKLKVGSVFRVKIVPAALGVTVTLDVISENGLDIYFSRKKVLSSNNIEFITELLKSWLHLYSDIIPYHGKVAKIIKGEKVLVDFGGNTEFGASKAFKIFKPKHLSIYRYNNISHAKWRKTEVGSGEFEEITDEFSVGRVEKVVVGAPKIEVGDWVVADRRLLNRDQIKDMISLAKERGIENLGRIKLGAEISRLSSSRNKNSGNLLSAHFDMTYYFSENIHFYIDAKKEVSAGAGFEASGLTWGAAMGTSFIPEIRFFPVVVDVFAGYRNKTFDLTGLQEPFLGEYVFKGPFIGAMVEFPIYNQLTLLGQFRIGPADEATNTNKLLGDIESANSRDLSVTAVYKINKQVGLYASYVYQKFQSKYERDGVVISTNSYLTRFGLALDF